MGPSTSPCLPYGTSKGLMSELMNKWGIFPSDSLIPSGQGAHDALLGTTDPVLKSVVDIHFFLSDLYF